MADSNFPRNHSSFVLNHTTMSPSVILTIYPVYVLRVVSGISKENPVLPLLMSSCLHSFLSFDLDFGANGI